MKISTLIKQLQEAKKNHGDIRVAIDLEPYDAHFDYRFESIGRLIVLSATEVDEDGVELKRTYRTLAIQPSFTK